MVKCVSMVLILHTNFMFSSLTLTHEECYPGFDCCYARCLLLQSVHMLNLNYAFEFRSQMSHICVSQLVLRSVPYITLTL